MRYLVLFTDNEDAVDQRQRHMQAHLAFLVEHAEVIEAAGPVVDTASDCFVALDCSAIGLRPARSF